VVVVHNGQKNESNKTSITATILKTSPPVCTHLVGVNSGYKFNAPRILHRGTSREDWESCSPESGKMFFRAIANYLFVQQPKQLAAKDEK